VYRSPELLWRQRGPLYGFSYTGRGGTPSVRCWLGAVTSSLGRGGSPTRPPGSNRADGALLNVVNVGVLDRNVGFATETAERLRLGVGVMEPELEKVSFRARGPSTMTWGREGTAVDGFSSMVTMVAEATLSTSDSGSEALRYVEIREVLGLGAVRSAKVLLSGKEGAHVRIAAHLQ
jgi:hypothetical protein